MKFGKIREAFVIVEHGHQPTVMLDWFIIEGIRRTISDAAFAAFTEIQHPGVFILLMDRKILNLGKDRDQTDARPKFGCDHQTIDTPLPQSDCLRHRWMERHPDQGMPCMGSIASLAQPIRDFIGYLPQLIISFLHYHGRIRVGSEFHPGFVHLHCQYNHLGVANGQILEDPFLGNGAKPNFIRINRLAKSCSSISGFFTDLLFVRRGIFIQIVD